MGRVRLSTLSCVGFTVAVLVVGVATASAAVRAVPSRAAAMAYFRAHCDRDAVSPATNMWTGAFRFNALYGDCGGGDGRDQHIWFFVDGRFVGTDAPNSSHEVIGLWRDDTTMAFLYVLYRRSDPECCPTGGGAIVRFRWNGKRMIRLDPLPPRAFTAGVAKGR